MTSAHNNQQRLYRMVSDLFGVPAEAVSDQSSPQSISNWDSLNHLNLVMALEGEFNVTISAEDALSLRDVGLIRAALRKYGVEI
jgi:acyl carrier protein